ncbi:MAG: hypothetical protein COT43_08055 [Candidatus Marinimicrobia bacterium CG08_land_8_20_14_0_20_45_22]|nr:MAG: hypothetical protein COT43_08055 [Candidatus Marinimicrobia bacterium CG08_land_8_20_14_0_20_45_22]
MEKVFREKKKIGSEKRKVKTVRLIQRYVEGKALRLLFNITSALRNNTNLRFVLCSKGGTKLKNMFIMLIIAIIALSYSQAFSQNKTWMREDYGTNFAMCPRFQSADGNIISVQFHNGNVSVMKLATGTGEVMWNYEYSASSYSNPKAAIEIKNQGILIVGDDYPSGSPFRNYILWTDKDGQKIADTTWTPVGLKSCGLNNVIIDSDDSTQFVCSGQGADVNDKCFSFLTKILLKNEKIVIESETLYENIGTGGGICKTGNGYLIVGISTSSSVKKMEVIAVKENLSEIWRKTHSSSPCLAMTKIIPVENGYILAGYFLGNLAAIAKIDVDGNLLWTKKYSFSGLQKNGEIKNIWVDRYNTFKMVIVLNQCTDSSRTILARISDDGSLSWFKECVSFGYDTRSAAILEDGMVVIGGVNFTTYPYPAWTKRVHVESTKIEPEKIIPGGFKISAYPNPFNSATKIEFALPEQGKFQISIFNLMGREIWRADEYRQAGAYSIVWNVTNCSGQAVGNGIYFIRILGKNFSAVQKVTLMK